MKKILLTSIFAFSILYVKAQTLDTYQNIFFTNLYPNSVGGNTSEQTHYHISSIGEGTGGSPLLDVKWWGGIKLNSEGGSIKLTSQAGDVKLNAVDYGYVKLITGTNENNYVAYQNADFILRYTPRGTGGRALVHDDYNTLAINYGNDFAGGTRLGTSFLVKGDNASLQGKLEAKEVKVTQSPTADFVFEEDYTLPTLEDVEKHIRENKHLPEIASAKEMEKEGVNVGEFQIKLLQKIEELTLYSIEQNKQIKSLKSENENLKQESAKIKSILERVDQLEKTKN